MIIKDTPGCQKRKTEEDPFLQKYFVTGMALGSVKG